MRRAPLTLGLPLLLAAAGCTMLVPVDGTPSPTTAPTVAPTATEPRAPAPAADAAPPSAQATPALPVLLRQLEGLGRPDGALIVTRGVILDDVAAFAGGEPLLHDPVLDDRGGSLRLEAPRELLGARDGAARLVTGILRARGGSLRLQVQRVEAAPTVRLLNLTIDDRPREPGERTAVTPGLHRLSVEASAVARVEFLLDTGDGPLARLEVDADPSDGFSATWSAAANQRLTIRTVGFSAFDEQFDGPDLDVLVGPPLQS